MTGGGFGGVIVALVDAGDRTFAARMPGRSWVTRASAGARELLKIRAVDPLERYLEKVKERAYSITDGMSKR